MHEIETKVLEVDVEEVKQKLKEFGAKEIRNDTLYVDWFGPKGLTHDGDDPWYLRVRTYSNGKVEVTYKDEPKLIDNFRHGSEINVFVDDHDKTKMLFEAVGLENYAHQEKKRISWVLGDIQFDLDTYPGMPTFLEIEVKNAEDIKKMLQQLNLENHETWNDGERTLIKKKYGLDWFNMRF